VETAAGILLLSFGVFVPRIAKTKKQIFQPWTAADIKTLRRYAGKRPARAIGKELKRSEGATRQKALALGVSLRVR
jgi:hypothetical protein